MQFKTTIRRLEAVGCSVNLQGAAGMAGGGVLLWFCLGTLGAALGGKVLVVPVEGSHWLSMKVLAQELVVRGHDVVLLVPENRVSEQKLAGCRVEVHPNPHAEGEMEAAVEHFKVALFLQPPKITDIFVNVQRWADYTSMHVRVCEDLLHNADIMGRLHKEGFDVVLTDPFLPCGGLLAHNLSVPVVYFLRGLPCGLEEIGAQCPSPPSYVPRSFSGLTDSMTFLQRVQNMVKYVAESVSCRYMYRHFDGLVGRYLEKDVSYRELISRGAVWLLRYDFTLLTPRPLMPNMVPIGGINCVKPSPLPADVQEFVEGSGDAGFIVFTLGSLVDHMPAKHTKAFLDAFRKIPQRVVWRHTGVLPDDMPDNVKIMKWIPQNALLAHPMARLFISHGGSHGIYEAICNAVPMVMLPLFGDQPDNVDSMTSRGVGTAVDMFDVSAEKLLEAFHKVLNDTSYRERMESLSAVHRDQAVKPLDLAVFWTEFVMRHKGADHLIPGAQYLSWYQYHSLDTLGLLAAVLVTAAAVALKCCCFCARKCGVRVEKRKTE